MHLSRSLQHLEGWSALLQASDPPISTTIPISPSVPANVLAPHPIAFSNASLKKLTGWAPKHRLDKEVVRATVEGFRREGNWPNAKPRCVSPYPHSYSLLLTLVVVLHAGRSECPSRRRDKPLSYGVEEANA